MAQIVRITPMLFEALAVTDGDPMIAARSPQLLQAWAEAEQQARAALLLSLAWHARTRESVDGETTAQQYAGDLQKFARDRPLLIGRLDELTRDVDPQQLPDVVADRLAASGWRWATTSYGAGWSAGRPLASRRRPRPGPRSNRRQPPVDLD